MDNTQPIDSTRSCYTPTSMTSWWKPSIHWWSVDLYTLGLPSLDISLLGTMFPMEEVESIIMDLPFDETPSPNNFTHECSSKWHGQSSTLTSWWCSLLLLLVWTQKEFISSMVSSLFSCQRSITLWLRPIDLTHSVGKLLRKVANRVTPYLQ